MDGKGALTSLLWEDFIVAPLEPAGPCRLLILDETSVTDPSQEMGWR